MIITEEKEQRNYFKKVVQEKKCNMYRIKSNGLLEYNGHYELDNFLAYIDGKWYGSRGVRQGASEGALENIHDIKFLFAITETRFCLKKDDGSVEYSSRSKPLSKDAVSFFIADQGNIYCLYVIVGTKYKRPLMLGIHKEDEAEKMLILAIIALVRQYDADAANEMEEFWFAKYAIPLCERKGNIAICTHIGIPEIDGLPYACE